MTGKGERKTNAGDDGGEEESVSFPQVPHHTTVRVAFVSIASLNRFCEAQTQHGVRPLGRID